MKTSTTKKIIWGVLTPLIWLLLWQIISLAVNSEVLVPAPLTVFKRLAFLIKTSAFWLAVGKSVLRIFSGLVLGVVLGIIFACLCRIFAANRLLSPVKTVIKATPVVSFIMLAWVWLKRDSIPVFISMLIVIPVVWQNTETGISGVDKKLKEFARAYGLTGFKAVKHIYIPSVKPYFTSALCTSAGLVWKAGVAAEVLCQPKNSIGANLYNAKNILETADVFAWTAVVIIISVILEKAIGYAVKNDKSK